MFQVFVLHRWRHLMQFDGLETAKKSSLDSLDSLDSFNCQHLLRGQKPFGVAKLNTLMLLLPVLLHPVVSARFEPCSKCCEPTATPRCLPATGDAS
jgi:hypothetical protein